MVQFKDHITGDVLVTAENGAFDQSDALFFKFPANYVEVKKSADSEETQTVVDLIHVGKMKKFDMWRVEKDIFDFGEKLGELVETKMLADRADFTSIVDYIFDLRAWFRANRETKDLKVYIGPSSTYMTNAYGRKFTPVFVREQAGQPPIVSIFKETVHAEGLVKVQAATAKPDISLQDLHEALPATTSTSSGGGAAPAEEEAVKPQEGAVSSVAQ